MEKYIHYLVFPFLAVHFIAITLLGWLLSFLPKGKSRRFHLWIYKYWSLTFYWMFFFREKQHWRVTSPLPKQYILTCNHYSGVDTIWVPGRFPVIPLAKSDLNKWPIVGNILRAAGMIFVNRHEGGSRMRSVDQVIKTLKQGTNVLIFPEGGCHGRFLSPFKDGAFAISKSTGIPIVPAYVFYEDEDTYELKNNEGFSYMLQCLFSRKNNRVHLYIFDTFYPENYSDVNEYRNAVTELYKSIQSECK